MWFAFPSFISRCQARSIPGLWTFFMRVDYKDRQIWKWQGLLPRSIILQFQWSLIIWETNCGRFNSLYYLYVFALDFHLLWSIGLETSLTTSLIQQAIQPKLQPSKSKLMQLIGGNFGSLLEEFTRITTNKSRTTSISPFLSCLHAWS